MHRSGRSDRGRRHGSLDATGRGFVHRKDQGGLDRPGKASTDGSQRAGACRGSILYCCSEQALSRRSPADLMPARVLVFVEYYLPGFKGGGPLRSINGLVSGLGDEFDFRIVTRSHDDGEKRSFGGVRIDGWNRVGNAQVFYASRRNLTTTGFANRIRETSPDAIYLNGCFGPMAVRLLSARRLGMVPRLPILVAPRGEFSSGALRLKRFKKLLFLLFAKRMRLFDGILWQASSPLEAADILNTVGSSARLKVAGDLFTQLSPRNESRPAKRSGSARFVFLSRIDRKKNLDFALRLLASLDGDVSFDIYGPITDATYWKECEEGIRRMPVSVRVAYHGAVPHHAVASVLASAHFFVLP